MAYDNKDRMKVVAEGGQTFIPNGTASLERAANTDAYTDGDVVLAGDSGPLIFQNMTQGDLLGGYITKAILSTNDASFATEMRLWLFTAAPATGLVNEPIDNEILVLDELDFISDQQIDGDANPELPFEAAVCIGYIDFGVPLDLSSCAVAQWRGHFHFYCRESGLGVGPLLYGILQARGVFTPLSEQTFGITLGIERG
jgi:hypothetical protein